MDELSGDEQNIDWLTQKAASHKSKFETEEMKDTLSSILDVMRGLAD